jgi:hypothetical protein
VIEAGQGRSDEEKQTRELGGGSSWDFTWWSGSRVIIDVGLGRQRTRTRSRLRSRAQRLLKRKGRGRGSGPGSRCQAIKVCGRKKELFKGRSTKRNTLDHGHPTRSIPSFVPLLARLPVHYLWPRPDAATRSPLEIILGLVLVVVPIRTRSLLPFDPDPPYYSPLLLFALYPVRPSSSLTSPCLHMRGRTSPLCYLPRQTQSASSSSSSFVVRRRPKNKGKVV